ncbi:MAG TPA: hypothetical protein VHV49_03160 [Pseudonocardiaceae bacterium]|jgi:hypothetical protein|nr:hypothetical protein [Pseudonocardiaceae bacterium]
MDFWKTMGVLLRRWYVSVPVFVLSVVLAGGVFFAVPTEYESTGTIVLTPPTDGGIVATNPKQATGPGNPLLGFEGSLTITTQLLIQSLSSPIVQDQIAAKGGVSTYQAGDGGTGGPFVVIIADAPTKAVAQRTVDLALKYAANELDTRQKDLDAPRSTFIGTQVVVDPTPAQTKLGTKVRAGGVALALGVVISLGAAFAIESVMVGRRRRQAELDRDGELASEPLADVEDDEADDRTAVTQKMRPAPRPLPQPVRTTGGPRPAPRPQIGPASNGRPPYPPSPPHKPHPAKPRVHPAPVPNTNGSSASKNGSGTTHDWPRSEFGSPDSSTG